MAGCAAVPLGAPKPVTVAPSPPPPSPLLAAATRSVAALPANHSEFAPLNDGNEGLGARLRLIERAQHTLDLQYFLMKRDLSGALLAQALLSAADRDVRVRILLDDVFTTASDQGLGLLNAHPNIDLRIFNPSRRPGPKAFGFLTEFSRINRRMHNKSFTADGAYSIIGGRNIADEYFQLDTTSEFADFDMLVVGPAVREISNSFDRYWNDGWAVPIEALRTPPTEANLAAKRRELDALLVPALNTYDRAVGDPYFKRLRAGQTPVFTGPTKVVSDRPGKLKVPVHQGERILGETLLRKFKEAQTEVVLLTPYFVPENYGARLFADLAQRGVRVRIVTNSLGSTNHPYVHAGYRRHRGNLLNAGVELYEIRGDALEALGLVQPGTEKGLIMHTKLAVIDGQQVFVGSLNLDPRSIKQNTEIGAFMNSPKLADALLTRLKTGLPNYTYRLSRDPTGRLLWIYESPNGATATAKEPGATVWKNLIVGFTELLGVELQL